MWSPNDIRGGGEFGPSWHQAALQEKRQNAYDDFQAVAEDLVKRGITSPKQLGITEAVRTRLACWSAPTWWNGPILFCAVVCQVPLVDMIRYTHIGAGASWIAEYGDPADPKARAWILKYSPYQNVKPDKTYPPVLFVTATSDDRVTPVHARKMAALMEAQGPQRAVLRKHRRRPRGSCKPQTSQPKCGLQSFIYLKQKLVVG